jgi:hypothetical protein
MLAKKNASMDRDYCHDQLSYSASLTKSLKTHPASPEVNLILNQLPDLSSFSTFPPFFIVVIILLSVLGSDLMLPAFMKTK